jgi:hypothetical protein
MTMGAVKINITVGLHFFYTQWIQKLWMFINHMVYSKFTTSKSLFLQGIFFSYRFILKHKSKSFCYYDYLLVAVACLITVFNSVCCIAWARKVTVQYLRENMDENLSPILKCFPWIWTKQLGYPVCKPRIQPRFSPTKLVVLTTHL